MYWTYRNHRPVRCFNTQNEAVDYAQKRQRQETIEYPIAGKWTVNYQGHDIPIDAHTDDAYLCGRLAKGDPDTI